LIAPHDFITRYGATGGVVDALRRRSGRIPPLWAQCRFDEVAGLDREEVTVYRPSDSDALEAQAKEGSHGPYRSGFWRQGIAGLCAGQRRGDSRGTPLPDGHAGAVPGDPPGESGGGGDVLGSVRGGGCGLGSGTRGPGGPDDAGALPGSGGAPDKNGPG